MGAGAGRTVCGALIAAGTAGAHRGIVGLVGSWFVLTTLTIWCGAILAFLLLHGLLFTLGQGAASVGLFLTVIGLEIAPFAWGVVMVRRARRSRSDDGDRAKLDR